MKKRFGVEKRVIALVVCSLSFACLAAGSVVKIEGSVELAPLLELADGIVDIVETGKTLLENDLAPYETIVPISARLISNKSSYNFKTEKIEQIKKEISLYVERG